MTIQLNKAFDHNQGPHWLDFLAFLIFSITAIDKIMVYYSRLPLEQVEDFQQTCMKYEIRRLDIIIVQAANWPSALKAAFQHLEKRKAKRMEQLKIIEAIKTSNLLWKKMSKARQRSWQKCAPVIAATMVPVLVARMVVVVL